MSDFTISGLSWVISLVVIISIVACFLLAWSLASRKAPTNSDGQVESTGHVWDEDLRELNNPLPRWWLYLFYITCVFGALYLVLYPGLGTYKGVFDWSSTGQYDQEVADAKSEYEPLYVAYLEQDIKDVASNPDAVAMGERLYLTYCTQCHGSDARGSRSFPNLADSDWLGAGTPDYIKTTVLNGRNAIMPAMHAAIGNKDEATESVAHYVLSLSDSIHDAEKATLGQNKFAVCSACHGPTGAGNPLIGAPNLTDDTWLYGGSLTSVQNAIKNGFDNQMPAFGQLLGEGKAHVVAAYIWSLSNNDVSEKN
ncbi:MAG: cytochrome c oxidase cbb3-type subunit 3 [bacterium]|jgi:cytochrome c oxidase cbb3-type subunit 3